MNLGKEILSYIDRTDEVKPFLDAGFTSEWMNSKDDLTRLSIFPAGSEEDHAYRYILDHWSKHRKYPGNQLFLENFPSFRFSVSGMSASEILEQAYIAIHDQVYAELTDTLQDILAGEIPQDDGLTAIARAIRKLREAASGMRVTQWDDPGADVDGLIHREITEGIRTGIPDLDRQFMGWQPGNLIVFIGRPKAGKTWTLLQSAVDSWHRGHRVLFITVEMTDAEISDRLNAMGARIPLTQLQMGKLHEHPAYEKRLREFREEMGDYDPSFIILQPQGACTAADIEAAIDKHGADVVYIDGFYFLTDEVTGKTGGNWEGQDALAKALKTIAMDRAIPVVTTTQVREKQIISRKADLDDVATMGGTALTMFSDMLFTINVDEEGTITICQSRTRTVSIQRIRGRWDWATTMFNVLEEDDQDDDDIPDF